jgi:hypothetical protein
MDEHLRRTLYLPVDRNSLATMMVLFDFADSTTSTAQRGETYIAPQALYLMNNAFFEKRAANLAKLLLNKQDLSDKDRIAYGVLRAWGRPAEPEEVEQFLSFVAKHPAGQASGDKPSPAWIALCRLLLASNNFFYID